MKASLRRQELLSYLEKNHIGYTSALCRELDVSAMTIHRDFEAMAKQGLVTLIRGGAAINHGTAVLYNMNLRQTQLPLEKSRIAARCAQLAQEGTTIFIDCGSTAERIAEAVKGKKNLTILTNSLSCAQVLANSKENKLIMVPGVFSSLLHGFSGQLTADFIRRFQVDILFLGANGIDIERGLTSPDYTDAETKRVLIRHANKVVVAADHTKLGKSFFVTIARLPQLHHIITDSNADEATVKAFLDKGANLELV